MSIGKQAIEALARDNPIVLHALMAHRHRGVAYEDALEAMVLTLAHISEVNQETLARVAAMSPIGLNVLGVLREVQEEMGPPPGVPA